MVTENGSFNRRKIDAIASPDKHEGWLKGKNAIVTGGTRGIGQKVVEYLAKEGVDTLIAYSEKSNKEKHANEVREIIAPYNIHSESVAADLTTDSGRAKLKDAFVNLFGGKKIDILVLSAPVLPKPNEVKSPYELLIDKLLPLMSKGGVIVFIQSVPSHFRPQLEEEFRTNEALKIYETTATGKYQDEQALRTHTEILEEHGVKLIIACPPLISDSTAIKTHFQRKLKLSGNENLDFPREAKRISRELGLPEEMTNEEAGERTVQVIKNKNLYKTGDIEFFK